MRVMRLMVMMERMMAIVMSKRAVTTMATVTMVIWVTLMKIRPLVMMTHLTKISSHYQLLSGRIRPIIWRSHYLEQGLVVYYNVPRGTRRA